MKKQVTYDILIPKLSDEIIDCQIARWVKNVGDFVCEGDVLVELETEKTTVEIESPTDGILECIYVFESEEVIDGERIGIIKSEFYYDDEDDVIDPDEDEEFEDLDDEDSDDEDYDDEEFDDPDLDFSERINHPAYVDSDDDYYS